VAGSIPPLNRLHPVVNVVAVKLDPLEERYAQLVDAALVAVAHKRPVIPVPNISSAMQPQYRLLVQPVPMVLRGTVQVATDLNPFVPPPKPIENVFVVPFKFPQAISSIPSPLKSPTTQGIGHTPGLP
jgi:hypothetical protein